MLYDYHQLDFLTPGISRWLASSRKQIRHNSKSRIYPRFRPQRQQRRTIRVENFGFFCALTSVDVFAIFLVTRNSQLVTQILCYVLRVMCYAT